MKHRDTPARIVRIAVRGVRLPSQGARPVVANWRERIEAARRENTGREILHRFRNGAVIDAAAGCLRHDLIEDLRLYEGRCEARKRMMAKTRLIRMLAEKEGFLFDPDEHRLQNSAFVHDLERLLRENGEKGRELLRAITQSAAEARAAIDSGHLPKPVKLIAELVIKSDFRLKEEKPFGFRAGDRTD